MRSTTASCIFAGLVALTLVGCGGGPATVNTWQRSVERYITEQGRGDPNVLRQVTWPDSRRAFSTIGGDEALQSQDANGLLLGISQVNGKPWFIFIVGVVNKQVVKDIRIAALNVAGEKRTWQVGHADNKAFSTYREHYEKLAKERFPGRSELPAQYTTFPQEADTFAVQSDPSNPKLIRVAHPASGAQWEVTIP